jgi:hypothetical protein
MAFQKVEYELPEVENNEKDELEIEPSSAEKVLEKKESESTESDNDVTEVEEVEESDDSEPEIEIVDDTPEKDQNRKVSDPPEDVTDGELDDYSQKVRKRISNLSKGYHDERRAKETALRERTELENVTKKLVEENKKLKGAASENHQVLLAEAKKTVENDHANAQRLYREAYEAGDTDKVLEAQDLLTTAKIKIDKLNNIKLPPLQKEEDTVASSGEENINAVEVDERAESWKKENSWFNDDVEMTSYALGLHTKLMNQGVNPKSDEYYETINARMRKLFPENFEDQLLEEEVEKPKKRSNVVAPATRSTSPKKIRLTTTQVTIAKRLGLTPQQYAEQVAIDMRKQNG